MLLILKVFECINNIEIYTIKSMINNQVQIGIFVPKDNLLPFFIPVMNLVIIGPFRIFL